MKYEALLKIVEKTPVFTTSVLLAGQAAPEDIRRQLNRWVHAGKIIKLRRGVYALPRPYAPVAPHPFAVATAMKKASYVSLQSALAHHGLIPEYVPVTTCVTTKRPEQLETPMGTFTYRHLSTPRFFGFTEYEVSPGQYSLLASPEKAILDLLYLVRESDSEHYLRELRLKRTPRLEFARLAQLTARFKSKKVERAVRKLHTIWEEEEEERKGRNHFMKELLFSAVREQPNDFMKRSVAREYLQSRILLSLQDHGAFTDWAFLGETALRFLYQLPRYSEDLDFSLTGTDMDSRFIKLMEGIKFDLRGETYNVEVKAREQKTVAAAFIKFPGLLFELGISPHTDEVLSVKVEIDTNPPAGAACETRVIRRFSTVHLLHYDRPSLLAGKLHAILARKYTKGRDLYDLAWYLSDPTWPSPNLKLLNNALQQTGWESESVETENWTTFLGNRLDELDWDAALKDVAPFLARPEDKSLVSPTLIKQLLSRRST